MSELNDPHDDWPDRTSLTDESGRTLLVYTAATSTRSGRAWADGVWRPSDVPVKDAAATALDTFTGWAFSTSDEELVTALQAAGAETLRHAYPMSHDLEELVAVPEAPQLRIEPLSARQVERHAERLGRLSFAAYPSSHPDHSNSNVEAAVSEMSAIARGELLGPVLEQSRLALHEGQIVGACILVDRPGVAPDGGPWVLDMFRDPTSAVSGVGRTLLDAVLRAAKLDRLPSVSLVVSHDNERAAALYARLGFVAAAGSWTLAVP